MKSPKLKCWLASAIVVLSPILALPLNMLFGFLGCHGNEGTGISCPPIVGIDYSPIADLVFMFSAWGLIFSLPAGLILFLVCSFVPWKRRNGVGDKE